MAPLSVLTFDHEGHPIQFDTWLDDLQLYLLSDSRDRVSLFDHTSGASLAPPATSDSATRSQWLTHDFAARLAVRNHLPLAKLAHFGQHKTAKALYDAVVARYSSPATAALGRLLLPYLFPELSAFATVPLVALLARPSLRGVPPPPLPPLPVVDILGAADAGAASALSGKCRSSKGKGGRSGRGGSEGGSGGRSGGGRGSGGGGSGGSGGGSGGFGGGGGGSDGGGSSGSSGSGGNRVGAVPRGGSGGGERQQQQRRSETPSAQQLGEWFAQRGASGGSVRCPYVVRMGDRAGQTCGKPHSQHRCFSRLDDTWRAEFGDEGIEAAALGASESALPRTAPAEALHTFTLDSGASRCFFHSSTTLTPLPAPVPVILADPSGGPVLARSSIVLRVWRTVALQDVMVTTTTPGGQRVSISTCTRTGRHLATFTRRPGSSLYTLTTEPPEVATSAQMSASGPVEAPCSYRLLPSFPRSLPPLPPSPAPPCLPCVEGRQRAAPHSSSFPPTSAPLQTLHIDVWGPARVSGQGRERYFLLVVDDFTRYTTVFSLRSKGELPDFLIPWIRAVRLQLRERVRQDLPVLRLHSGRGGEFSSDLLRDFCRGEGILQSFTLPASLQQNGVAERRIGVVMEVARTSMIHATAPHFLWPFAVRFTTPPHATSSPLRTSHLTSRFPSTVSSLLPPPPLFLAPGPPPVDPLPPKGPAPSGAAGGAASGGAKSGGAEPSRAEPTGAETVGAEPGGAEPEGAEPGGAEPEGADSGGAESEGAESGGAEPGGAEPWGAEFAGAEPRGAESEGAESGGAEPRGTVSSGGPAVASPRVSPRLEPLSPQQLREWFAQCTRLRSGATGTVGSAAGGTRAGGAG
ncbi:unnamed protein product, partial [Closterium sp. NIES-53]